MKTFLKRLWQNAVQICVVWMMFDLIQQDDLVLIMRTGFIAVALLLLDLIDVLQKRTLTEEKTKV